jgi:hypothetical protein
MTMCNTAKYNEIQFSDADVVNPDDFIPDGEYNPHNVRPFLVHDAGFPVGIVFASSLDEALDILADEGKLEAWELNPDDTYDNVTYGLDTEEPTCAFLGNDGKPFDIEALNVVCLPNPPFSFVALFQASQA